MLRKRISTVFFVAILCLASLLMAACGLTIIQGQAANSTTAGDTMACFSDFVSHWEGREPTVYPDTQGNPSVGVGFNLNRKDARSLLQSVNANYDKIRAGTDALNDSQIDSLLATTLQEATDAASSNVENYDKLPQEAKLVVVDMIFNLGVEKFNGFVKFKAALEKEDYKEAAAQLEDSDWYSQVGQRSKNHENVMKKLSGEDVAIYEPNCGDTSSILGKWEGTFGNKLEFFANGILIQTNPSGHRFASTYALSQDGKTLTAKTTDATSTTTVSIDADTARMFDTDFHRAAPSAPDSRSAAQLLVGSWSGEGGSYDFYADGTWVYYLSGPQPVKGGHYTLSADNKTLDLESAQYGKEETIISLVTSTTLVLRPPFVFDRTADAPAHPPPSGSTTK